MWVGTGIVARLIRVRGVGAWAHSVGETVASSLFPHNPEPSSSFVYQAGPTVLGAVGQVHDADRPGGDRGRAGGGGEQWAPHVPGVHGDLQVP